jgi:hypothetical protein
LDCCKKKQEQANQANSTKGKGNHDNLAEVVALDLNFTLNKDEEESSGNSDADLSELIERDVYDDSSDDTDVSELMNQFYFDSSSNNESA